MRFTAREASPSVAYLALPQRHRAREGSWITVVEDCHSITCALCMGTRFHQCNRAGNMPHSLDARPDNQPQRNLGTWLEAHRSHNEAHDSCGTNPRTASSVRLVTRQTR